MATKQVRKPGRPAKKTRRTFAAGGVVRLEQGREVPKPEWELTAQSPPYAKGPQVMTDTGYSVDSMGRSRTPLPMNSSASAGETAASQSNRSWKENVAENDPAVRQAVAAQLRAEPMDARGGVAVANQQRGEAAPAGPGYRGPRAPVETYTGPVADFFYGSATPAPGVASRASQGVPARAMVVADAAPVARAAPVPAEARRPGGTIGRLGRTPSVPTDADFWPQAAPAQASAPATGAVPPAAPNNAYGTQDEILGAAAQGLKAQRATDAVSPERVAGARRQAQFEERNIARDRGQGMVGGSLAEQQAMADNALLQKWYSLAPNERGRMPASVENAKYRGADDTETAFNVARARIMEAPLDPAQQAQALANLDKTRADMLNQAQQTRQTGEYQQGQIGNDRERAGAYRQQVEQTGQHQQDQLAHQQRVAQLALDQGVAEGALLPDEEYQKDRALDDTYNAAYEQRRTIRERARRVLMTRLMKGETLQDVLANPGTDDERALLSTLINPSVAMRPQTYAGGGMVSPQAPVYGGMPDAQRADPLINAYRVYTTQSKAMGAPTVPFAEFSSLYAGAVQGPMQSPVGMARGGAVPAAGKMVIDTDPNAPTDSIPAVIDGQHPARLDSGEFVFPHDVSMYYGTKFLNGLIEKAKAALGQGAPGGKPAAPQEQEDDEEMEVEFADGGLVQDRIDAGYGLTAENTFGYANPTEQFASALDTARHDARWSQGHTLTASQQDRAIDDRAALGGLQARAVEFAKPEGAESTGAVQAAAPAQTRAPAAPIPQAPPRRRMRTYAPDMNNLDEPLTTPSYAAGGSVSGWNVNRAKQIEDAVNGAVGAPQVAPPPTASQTAPLLTPDEQAWMEMQRAKEADQVVEQKPAWRRALGFAGGGAVQVPRSY